MVLEIPEQRNGEACKYLPWHQYVVSYSLLSEVPGTSPNRANDWRKDYGNGHENIYLFICFSCCECVCVSTCEWEHVQGWVCMHYLYEYACLPMKHVCACRCLKLTQMPPSITAHFIYWGSGSQSSPVLVHLACKLVLGIPSLLVSEGITRGHRTCLVLCEFWASKSWPSDWALSTEPSPHMMGIFLRLLIWGEHTCLDALFPTRWSHSTKAPCYYLNLVFDTERIKDTTLI